MLVMEQSKKIKSLDIPKTYKYFASKRSMGKYIGVNCRPGICAPVQLVASGTEGIKKEDYLVLGQGDQNLQATADEGLKFVPLDLTSAKLMLYTDD